MQSARKRLFTATAIIALGFAPLPAVAFDPSGNPIADAFFAQIEAGKARIKSVGSVSGSGGRTEISGLVAEVDNRGSIGTLKFGSVVFEGGKVGQGGRLSASRFQISGFSANKDGTTVGVGEITATDVTLPSADEFKAGPSSWQSTMRYSEAQFTGILIQPNGGGDIPIAAIALTAGDVVDGEPTRGSLKMSNLIVSASSIADPGAKAQLAALGYSKVVVSAEIAGRLDPGSGVLDLHTFKVMGADIGTLSFTAKLQGLTKQVRDLLRKSEENPQQALQALQSLIIEGATLRFDNNSIVERLLDMQAKAMGVSRDQFVGQITQTLPLMLGMLQNPEFQAMVASAATAFLKSPGNISVTAQPASPVPVAQIIGSVMMAPQSLPNVLNVKVSANN